MSRPAIFTIESSVLDELKKDPSEYRQKDLFDARGFNATRLEIVSAGQTYAFEKTKVKNKEGQDEEKWRQLTPQARELDQPAFDTLLSALTAIRATGFVDAAAAKALSAPELSVTIKFDEGKKEDKVALAKSGTDGFASRAGEPGAAKIDASRHRRGHQSTPGAEIVRRRCRVALVLSLLTTACAVPRHARPAVAVPFSTAAGSRSRRSGKSHTGGRCSSAAISKPSSPRRSWRTPIGESSSAR